MVYQEIQSDILSCNACALRLEATVPVPPVSHHIPSSRLMWVGRNPGFDEDAQGQPFIGRAGVLLDSWNRVLGLRREDVYITNIVKCYSSNNHFLLLSAIVYCKERFLYRELELVKPKFIILLGDECVKGFLGDSFSVSQHHGQIIPFNNYFVFPLFHPGYILRNASKWPIVEQDLLKIKEFMSNCDV